MASLRGFVDNYATQLNGATTAIATTITVDDGAAIATVLATDVDFVALTIDDGTVIEIVHCTASAANILTVTRGEEGTSGFAFADNSQLQCRLTTGGINNIGEWRQVDVQDLTSTASTVDFPLSTGTFKVTFELVTQTGNNDIELLQGTGGGPTFQTTLYDYSGRSGTATTDVVNQGAAQTEIVILPGGSNGTDEPIGGHIVINNVDVSTKHAISYEMTQLDLYARGAAVRDNAEVVTAIRLQPAAGNFRSGSKFVLYRRNN